jgi:hypothetical protein
MKDSDSPGTCRWKFGRVLHVSPWSRSIVAGIPDDGFPDDGFPDDGFPDAAFSQTRIG